MERLYPVLPGTRIFHTSLLKDSVYSTAVFEVVKDYYYEKVGINLEFRLCNKKDIFKKLLDNKGDRGICEITLEEFVKEKLLREYKNPSQKIVDILKNDVEEVHGGEGFIHLELEQRIIYPVASFKEKQLFEIARDSGLNNSSTNVIDEIPYKARDFFVLPLTEYDYNQSFAKRICSGIMDFTEVGPSHETPKDTAEDHDGNPIADLSSIDPSKVKYHFFLTESQKKQVREYFS